MEETEGKVDIKSENESHLDENASTPQRHLNENDETPLRDDVITSPDPPVFYREGNGHGWESDNDDVEIPPIPRTPRSYLTMQNSPTNVVHAEPEAPVVKTEPSPQLVKLEPEPDTSFLDELNRELDEDIFPKLEVHEIEGTASLDGIPRVFSNREEMNDMDLEPPQVALNFDEPHFAESLDELEAIRKARQKELQELDEMQEAEHKHKKKKRKRKRAKSGSNELIDDNQKENQHTSRDSRRTSEENQRDNRRQHEDNPRDNRRQHEDNPRESRRHREDNPKDNPRRHHEDNPRDNRRHYEDSQKYKIRHHDDNHREKRARQDNHGDNRRDYDDTPSDNRRRHEEYQRDSKHHGEDHYRDNKRPREEKQSEIRNNREPTFRVTASSGLLRVATIKSEPMCAVGADPEEECIYVRDDERQIKVINHEKLFVQEQGGSVTTTVKPETAPEKLTKREKCNLAVSRAMKVLELFERKRTNDQEDEFLMVNTIHKVPKSSSYMSQEAFENPSPICNNYNVVYEFNSAPGTRIDLAKWGLETVPNSTRDLLRLLSYDVDHLKQARLKTQPCQRILKLKQEQLFNAPSEPEESDPAALYINASTQTDLRLHTQSVGTQAKLQGQPRGAFWQDPDFDMTFLTTSQTNVMFALQELYRTLPTPTMAVQLYKSLQPALDVQRECHPRK